VELEREGDARNARIARVVAHAELTAQVVQPACHHTL
jgi:hypothetical protein